MIFDLFLKEKKIPKLKLEKPIDILIPVYNGREYLSKLLKSIIDNTNIPFRLIICNDNSSDETIKEFLENYKKNHLSFDIIVIHNKENLGFVKTINKLSEFTQNHFVILNSDTEVPPHWLERLIYPIINNERVASVTPFSNSGSICSFPKLDKNNELFAGLDLETIDSYFQYVNYEKYLIELPTGVGFCMAINKDVWEKVGKFDESFGKGYGEENDWSMRAIKSGFKNVIAPNLFIYHKHGVSFKKREKNQLIEKNTKLLLKKHPEFVELMFNFLKLDPLKSIRDFVQIKILSEINEAVLLLDNIFIPETEDNLIVRIENPFFLEECNIEFIHKKIGKIVVKLNNVKSFGEIIKLFNIKRVI